MNIFKNEKELQMNIARNLRVLRKLKKAPQIKVARTLGLIQSALSRVETGSQQLSAPQLGMAARYFKVSPDIIIFDSLTFPDHNHVTTKKKEDLIMKENQCFTCNECGWVHFGVTRKYALSEVRRFNEYYKKLSKKDREDFGGPSSIKLYERCCRCGGSYKNFRLSKPKDCPDSVTMNPIIIYTPRTPRTKEKGDR